MNSKTTAKTKRQTKAERNEAALRKAGLWDYWMGSASQAYVEKIEAGKFTTVTINADGSRTVTEGR